MFFATWVAETSDLRAHLLALNAYAHAAHEGGRGGGRGLPGLVAVDEQTTEPSPGAAAAYLKNLGAPLVTRSRPTPRAGSPTGMAWPTSRGSS